MKNIMLIGPSGCGKSTFIQALHGITPYYKKTQSVEVVGHMIDTPGEYLENPGLYRALAVTAAQADMILLMQTCGERNLFPPGFAAMFGEKPVFGVVCKIDLCSDEKIKENACTALMQAGAKECFQISALRGDGMDLAKKIINQD